MADKTCDKKYKIKIFKICSFTTVTELENFF
jgi:hypothetical protein